MTILFTGLTTTFRTLGTAATPHNLFTIENMSTGGGSVIVRVKRLVVQLDATALLVSVMPQIKVSRCAVPSNGTELVKSAFDTAQSSHSLVKCRGATASDGGSASAITATAGDPMWQQYCMRMHSVVGQVLAMDNSLIPALCDTNPIIVRYNQALLVQLVATAGASNPATNHWFVQCVWEEEEVV